MFCISCKFEVGYTDHFQIAQNELNERLAGRVNIRHGAALFDFVKDGKVQTMIHKLKYGRQPEIGIKAGRMFGKRMNESSLFPAIDIILPIPVHPKRKWKRGYNQSHKFAAGIAEVCKVSISTKCLLKASHIKSQTTKLRAERFENVLQSFKLKNQGRLEGKKVLICDDVMTTGATIEAAVEKLSSIKNIEIYLALIALAHD